MRTSSTSQWNRPEDNDEVSSGRLIKGAGVKTF